jgi:hypothetical protein
VIPVAGPDQGLRGDLVALTGDGMRTLALNRDGELFVIARGRVRTVAVDPEFAERLVEHSLASPERTLLVRDPVSGAEDWLVLDGWVVWRVQNER